MNFTSNPGSWPGNNYTQEVEGSGVYLYSLETKKLEYGIRSRVSPDYFSVPAFLVNKIAQEFSQYLYPIYHRLAAILPPLFHDLRKSYFKSIRLITFVNKNTNFEPSKL